MEPVRLVVLVCVFVALISRAGAQTISPESVHLKPVGSVVSGSFTLVDKWVPLPEGGFTLVAINIRDSEFRYGDYANRRHKMVDVFLGQIVDNKLRAAVVASALLAWGGGRREWIDEPCKRDDTIYKRDRVAFMEKSYSQDCLLVNHIVNSLGQSATGIYATAASWIKDYGGTTPIATLIDATITRIEVGEYLVVRYAFNPEAYGCDSAPSNSWTTSAWHKSRAWRDKEKHTFSNSVVEFGKAVQVQINDAFQGRQAPSALSTLYRCSG